MFCFGREHTEVRQLTRKSYQEWEYLELTVDSGVCDTGLPSDMCGGSKLEESQAHTDGVIYDAA